MKTERVVLLTTPDFKSFLMREAKKEGVSVAELVRSRCEGWRCGEEAELVRLAAELRGAVVCARSALSKGLSEAHAVLSELQRVPATSSAPRKKTTGRRCARKCRG